MAGQDDTEKWEKTSEPVRTENHQNEWGEKISAEPGCTEG